MARLTFITTSALFLLFFNLAPVAVYGQVDQAKQQACQGAGGTIQGDGSCQTSGETRTLPDLIRSITNILVFVVGAVAVIMLIIGGLRYVLSGGDQQGVEGAKNTILYAVVGIVVAFMAFAIVNFVISSLD